MSAGVGLAGRVGMGLEQGRLRVMILIYSGQEYPASA